MQMNLYNLNFEFLLKSVLPFIKILYDLNNIVLCKRYTLCLKRKFEYRQKGRKKR